MQTFLEAAIIILVVAVIYLVWRPKNVASTDIARSLSDVRKELQERMDRIDDQIDKKMQHSHLTIQQQFNQTSKIISDVTEKLTTLGLGHREHSKDHNGGHW